MGMDSDIIYNVCEKLFKEFRYEVTGIAKKIADRVIEEMKKNHISIIKTSSNNPRASSFTSEKLIVETMIINRLKSHFETSFLVDVISKELQLDKETEDDGRKNTKQYS